MVGWWNCLGGSWLVWNLNRPGSKRHCSGLFVTSINRLIINNVGNGWPATRPVTSSFFKNQVALFSFKFNRAFLRIFLTLVFTVLHPRYHWSIERMYSSPVDLLPRQLLPSLSPSPVSAFSFLHPVEEHRHHRHFSFG